MKIVVIDDKIVKSDVECLVKNRGKKLFNSTSNCSDCTELSYSHGTICTAILAEYVPLDDIIGISIADHAGKITVKRACEALRYCSSYLPDYICMSVGAKDWLQTRELCEITNVLSKQGIQIFAAWSNDGSVVFPSAYPWVNTVKYDEKINGVTQLLHPCFGKIFRVGYFESSVLKAMEDYNTIFSYRTNSMAVPYLVGRIVSGKENIQQDNKISDIQSSRIKSILQDSSIGLIGEQNEVILVENHFIRNAFHAVLLSNRIRSDWMNMVLYVDNSCVCSVVNSIATRADIIILDMRSNLQILSDYDGPCYRVEKNETLSTYNSLIRMYGY